MSEDRERSLDKSIEQRFSALEIGDKHPQKNIAQPAPESYGSKAFSPKELRIILQKDEEKIAARALELVRPTLKNLDRIANLDPFEPLQITDNCIEAAEQAASTQDLTKYGLNEHFVTDEVVGTILGEHFLRPVNKLLSKISLYDMGKMHKAVLDAFADVYGPVETAFTRRVSKGGMSPTRNFPAIWERRYSRLTGIPAIEDAKGRKWNLYEVDALNISAEPQHTILDHEIKPGEHNRQLVWALKPTDQFTSP